MRRIIIPLIVIILAFAVSCSGSPGAAVEEIDILPADGKPLVSSPEFSADLFVVEVTYTDDSTEILDGEGLVTAEYEEEADGSYTWNGMVEASYGGKTSQKTFILEPMMIEIPANGDENSYKQLVSLTIYQERLATEGEEFNPSYFKLEAEFADGYVEVLDGEGYITLQVTDGTMNKGDYVTAFVRGYRVKLAITFID